MLKSILKLQIIVAQLMGQLATAFWISWDSKFTG